jgi:hypothetical protein
MPATGIDYKKIWQGPGAGVRIPRPGFIALGFAFLNHLRAKPKDPFNPCQLR